ncbi:MAG: M48 family metalloprotease [Methylotenera sp.]|nr:M48 family metalloprotease [Methylotenera sp.]MDD4925944.1 M48 family metalloprotease [Methylotenera sp.]
MKMIKMLLLVAGSLMLMGFDIGGWFGGVPKEKLATKLQPGAYKAGSRAVGIDKDVNNMRATGAGLIPENAINPYLNRIKDKLLVAAGIQDYPGKVYVRAAMMQWGAETTADGNIYINSGTLRNLESEDEVAALLAHELSHALLKHHDSDIFVNFQKQLQSAGEWSVGLKAALDTIGSGAVAQISNDDARKLRQSQYLIMLSAYIISPAWNRGQETDADRLGADLLVKAGYNFYAMNDLLAKEEAWQKNFAPDLDPKLITERITVAPEKGEEGKLGSIINDVFGKGLNLLVDKLSQKHPDPVARQQDYRKYAQKFYRGENVPEKNVLAWHEVWRDRKLAEVRTNYEYAYRAEKSNDTSEAQLFSSLALRGATSNHAYPLLVASQVLESKGDRKKALATLEKAANSEETVGLVYIQMAELYEKSGDKANALQAANTGYERLNKPPHLKPQMIKYHKKAGDNNGAIALVISCGFESPEYKEKCNEANADKKI